MTQAWRRRAEAYGPWLILLAAVAAAYRMLPSMGYVLWDDDLLVQQNAILGLPFGEALRGMFGGFYNGDYIPLTLLSYWLEVRAFGMHALVQHADNLALHSINIILLGLWLQYMPEVRRYGWLIAVVFALHPVQVESVAWVSERKGLLATACYFGAILCSLYPAKKPRRAWLAYALLFMCGAAAKANGLFLPLWLVGVDAARRMPPRQLAAKHGLVILGAGAFAVLRIYAYASSVPTLGAVALSPERLLQWPVTVLAAVGFYLKTLFVPSALCIIYPSFLSAGDWSADIAIAVCAAVLTVGSLVWLRLWSGFLWLLFILVTLAPVLNLIPRLNFVNDRYLYVPLVGMVAVAILIAEGWLAKAKLLAGARVAKLGYWALGSLLLGLGLWASGTRAQVWTSNINLWGDTASKVPRSSLAHNNLGQAYQDAGRVGDAVTEYKQSLEYAEDSGLSNLAYNNLATIYSSRQYPAYFDLAVARGLLEKGIAQVSRPDDSLVLRFNLGLVRLQQGDTAAGAEVIRDLRERLRQTPNQRYRFLVERSEDILTKLQKTP